MRTPFKHIKQSLAAKLIIALGSLVLIGAGISWYVLIDTARKNLLTDAIRYAASYSDLIKRSTRQGMLTFHREDIQHILESIGSREDIKKLRIFDSRGRIFYSSQKNDIGYMVNRTFPACIGCHRDPEWPSASLTNKNQWTIYEDKKEHRLLTFVDPIYNEPACATAACHAHPQEQRVLGILDADFSLFSVVENIKTQMIEITIYGLVLVGISSVVLYLILRKLVIKPVSTLSHAMERVADGDLTQTVVLTSQDEMDLLAKTFNVMTEDLNMAMEKMANWKQTLEEEIANKTAELRMSQDKLIQAEKLAALGRLTSDVAHEIRNPLTCLGGFAHRLYKIVTDAKEKEYTEVIIEEANKLEKILKNVLTFARHARLHLETHTLGDVVHDVVKLYSEALVEKSIVMEIELDATLPQVLIDRDQVTQALCNLITNALDVMPHGGTLTIAAGEEKLHDVPFGFLKVSDTGAGIPSDKLPRIFEPFFTTKEIGHGTGLGLSISRKIIEEHGGFITAESTVGVGSTFTFFFPYQSGEESLKMQCWEYMKCGRDKDATMKCPAYPSYGRMCWVLSGTFCEGKVIGMYARKYKDCKKCEFFQKVRNREI